jgi:hypothetical protein
MIDVSIFQVGTGKGESGPVDLKPGRIYQWQVIASGSSIMPLPDYEAEPRYFHSPDKGF